MLTVTADVSINAAFGVQGSLVVTRTGDGTGTVTSSPGGISCGTTCSAIYLADAMVTLTATPAVDSTFAGWSGGGCNGTEACTVMIATAVTVNAHFTKRQHVLTAVLAGNGGGNVSSEPAGITCGTDCAQTYGFGTLVTLSAAPDATSDFTGWSGACNGTAPCTLMMTADRTATASFTRKRHALTVVLAGNGTGTVSFEPAGIQCGTDCTETYDIGTRVTLTAAPASGGDFTGWSAPCTGTGPCVVTLAAPTTVTATFEPPPNFVFATSGVTSGNLGGLTGADSFCQSAARNAGLPGTYRAWLSTATVSAVGRLGNDSGWIRPDGKPVANTAADLVAGRMFHPIRVDERGGDTLDSSSTPRPV